MTQFYKENTEYEILTPNGWEDFDGVIFNKGVNKQSKKITFSDGSFVIATNDHVFYSHQQEIKVKDLKTHDFLDTLDSRKKILNIEELFLDDTYDIFNAENHVIIANGLKSHQCDEIAFISPNIQTEFFS